MIPRFIDRLLCADDDCGGLNTKERFTLAFCLICIIFFAVYGVVKAITS